MVRPTAAHRDGGGVVLDVMDAHAVRSWAGVAVAQLDSHRAEINDINVFPVADGDTGSNMLQTLRAAVEGLGAPPATVSDDTEVLALLAAGAARGAVGNSGFIASQVLRGLAEAASDGRALDGSWLVAGLAAGAALAREAVVAPVDGTILSVADAAARAAERVSDSACPPPLPDVIRAARDAALDALERTTSQLPELAAAGVVDAGGRGLVLLLAALAEVVDGAPVAVAPLAARPGHSATTPNGTARTATPGAPMFEVQYLLEGSGDAAVPSLRRRLAELGDSVVVVGVSAGSWKVHVHTTEAGAAVEAGIAAAGGGRVHGITVEVLEAAPARAAAPRWPDAATAGPAASEAGTGETAAGVAVVAVAPGAGLAHLFQAEGVAVVDGGDGAAPTADDVLAAVRRARAHDVVLLPNASVVTGVAESAAAAARRDGLRVTVVPTRSPVQGLAAVAVHDPTRYVDDDVVAMAEAAAATRFAELTVATGPALTAAGPCQAGDVLGLIDGEVVEVGRSLFAVAYGLVDRLAAVGAELMTILVGRTAPPRLGELVAAHVHDRSPLTDVTVYEGGQADHPVIIGVE